jgi:lipoprotein-anchoring transpeptidase ErfK/SrfK
MCAHPPSCAHVTMTSVSARHRLAIALVLAAALGAPAAASAAAPSAHPAGSKPLSDEVRVTRWAYPASRAIARRVPVRTARPVGRLRWLTEDGLAEDYLVLSRWTDARGRTWLRLRLPQRPNGRTGWVPRSAVGPLHVVRTFLDIDKRRLRARLYRSGKLVFSARIGIGKPSTPTPSGHFWIREKFPVRHVPLYGPFAMGTSAYAPTLSDWPGGGVVGLHGTDQPWLVPGRPSHGCIRLHNADITKLYRLTPRGTPVHIHW